MGCFLFIPAAQFWHKNTQYCAAGIVVLEAPCSSTAFIRLGHQFSKEEGNLAH
jgi:hypothetical protein